MGKVAVIVAVVEDIVGGYGNHHNLTRSYGVSTQGKRIMRVTIAGQNKLTRGKRALQPRSKEKILARGKARATARVKAKATAKAKAMAKKVARENAATDNQHQRSLNPLKEKKDRAILREGGSSSCKRT